MFDIKLKTFLTLCKTGSYTKTALQLNMTQPAVSNHIKLLENYYDAKLFYYDEYRQLRITDKGSLLKNYAQTLESDSILMKQIMGCKRDESVRINIGILSSSVESSIVHILSIYMKACPEVTINILTGEADDLLDQLRCGHIHACIIDSYCSNKEFEIRELFKTNVICICAPEHELSNKTATFSQIQHNKVVFREYGSCSQINLENILRRNCQTLDNFAAYIETGSVNIIKQLVKDNIGISFVYKFLVQEELDLQKLSEIVIAGFNCTYTFNLVWMKNSFFNNGVETLFNTFTNYIRLH